MNPPVTYRLPMNDLLTFIILYFRCILCSHLLLLRTKNAFSNLAGPPAIIEVDIMVRSMGPISEVDMVSDNRSHYAFREGKENRGIA